MDRCLNVTRPVGRSVISRLRWLVVVLLAGATMSCLSPTADLNAKLEDGTTILQNALAAESPTIVLVYSATICLYCNTPLPRWEALAAEGRVNLVLIVAGEVTDADRKVFKIRRVPVTGILSDSRWPEEKMPSEYLIVDGEVVASAEGRDAVVAMKLWEHPDITEMPPAPGAALMSNE